MPGSYGNIVADPLNSNYITLLTNRPNHQLRPVCFSAVPLPDSECVNTGVERLGVNPWQFGGKKPDCSPPMQMLANREIIQQDCSS